MTKAQREIIERAINPDHTESGIVWEFGLQSRTIHMMRDEGLIAKSYRLSDEERAYRNGKIAELVSRAKEKLDTGDWETASVALNLAYSQKNERDQMVWWVTDKGRLAIRDSDKTEAQ